MKPWILCTKEMPNECDIMENNIVFYDTKYRNVYINEKPIYMTESEIHLKHLCWMKIEDFLENCGKFPLSD